MNAIEPLVVLLDRTGRAVWVSRGDSGVPEDELLGTAIWDWTIPQDRDLSRRCFADCLVHRVPQRFTVTVDANGRLVQQRVRLDYTGGPKNPVIVKSDAIHPGLAALTRRQRDVLRLIAGGRARKQIARELGLSVVTIDSHCAAVCERLGLHSAADLAVFAALHARGI